MQSTEQLLALINDLASVSDATFHGALGRLSHVPDISGATGIRLIEGVARKLITAGSLGERVQADRIHTILRRIEFRENALSDLAVSARAFPPGLRNAIAGFLAPTQRRLLLGGRRGTEDISLTAEAVSTSVEPRVREDSVAVTGLTGTIPPQRDSPFSTVVMFAGPFQDANKKLLSARGFGPLVWTSLDSLQQDLSRNEDICACLIDGSALQALDAESQKRLFHLLGSYSTFLWIRVEDKFLEISHFQIRECLRSARCMQGEVPAALLSIQSEATLREREVQDIDAASKALRAREEAEFIPGEISSDQAKVLMAAVKLHARELRIEGQVELKSLEARFLSGGQSTARIAVLRVNQDGYPIVAKIDNKKTVLDEMRRFRTFIEPWDNELRPKLHFHGQAAVLLFGLVPDERDRYRPAEVFSSRLDTLWNDQIFSKAEQDLTRFRDALAEGAENTARRLRELNLRRPPNSTLLQLGNPDMGVFQKLAESGVDWGLLPEAKVALSKAVARFSGLENAATVHGDVHLKNILLRDDRFPHLIDYAGSGPGHPSIDLVRFELALFLGPLRQIASERQCAEYQKYLTLELSPYPFLEERFAELHRCHLNIVCLRGCVAARDEALSVLNFYGGERADYQAAKYLVAWQNLLMMGRHTGLARAIIAALAPEISSW